MPLGYLRARILYDQQQNPVDLLFTDANLAAKKITGKSNFNGLRASSLGLDSSSNLLQLTTLSPNKDYLDDTHFVSRINKYFHFISYMTRPDEVIYLFSDKRKLSILIRLWTAVKKFCVIFTTIYRPELNFTTKTVS